MNHAKDLIAALAQYYGRDYNRRMASDIADRYSWIGPKFKTALYDEVIRTFTPTQMRSMPDVAALTAAEKNLPPANTMVDHTEVKALPEPEVPTQTFDIDAMIEKGRREEYARVKAKVDKGNATAAEQKWFADYDKPKRSVPGVKHISRSVEREAEENW